MCSWLETCDVTKGSGFIKLQNRKFVSMIVAFLMILACVAPAFAADTNDSTGYAVNSNGETYGNYLEALEIGYEAELIYAEGIDGTLGYVRASDLDDGVESPSDVTVRTANETIPLYASDGITVLGRFQISTEGTKSSRAVDTYAYGTQSVIATAYYQAYFKSGIKSSFGGVTVITKVRSSEYLEINNIGINARCYRQSNGALVKSSGWKYNSTVTKEFEHEMFYRNPYTSNEFYSCGEVKIWNPSSSSYVTSSSNRSPVAQPG